MASKLTFAVPVTWNNERAYEVNMIVFVGKRAYTAIQDVPTGVQIDNTQYWAETGVPYVDTSALETSIETLSDAIDTINDTTIPALDTRVSANSGNIATITGSLATAQEQINSAQATIDNIMISLYTPYSAS
jgi:hypothetical protein